MLTGKSKMDYEAIWKIMCVKIYKYLHLTITINLKITGIHNSRKHFSITISDLLKAVHYNIV